MKINKTIEPKMFYKWIIEVLNDFYNIKPKLELNLNQSISNIFNPLGWILYDWLLFLTTLEIEFEIDIPDNWGENMGLTLGELVSNLATLEVKPDKSWGFRKIMALGYLNIDTEEEKEDETEGKFLN